MATNFSIQVRFLGGLTPSQQDVFQDAARRWSELIVGDLRAVRLQTGEIVDDVLIDAVGVAIDGAGGPNGNVLGQAAPDSVPVWESSACQRSHDVRHLRPRSA